MLKKYLTKIKGTKSKKEVTLIIDEIISNLEKNKILNDEMYSDSKARMFLRRGYSLNKINQSLRNKGIDDKYARQSINKIKEEVILDGRTISLSTSEFEALLLFANNSNKVLDREFLVENLRGITWQTYDRSVDVLVCRLRNKLGEKPARTRFIKTIHGVGFKFIATPTKK